MNKRILFIAPLLLMFACSDSDPAPEKNPEAPSCALSLESVDGSSCRFTVTTDAEDAEYGYLLRKADESAPTAPECLAAGTSAINRSASVSLTGLSPRTDYVVYAAVRRGELSSPAARLPFTTTQVASGMLSLGDVTSSSFTFTVSGGSSKFRFSPIEKAAFDMSGYEPENYLSSFGFPEYGDKTFEWVDKGVYAGLYTDVPMSVLADCDYIVFAAPCNENDELTGPVDRIDFHTPARPATDASVKLTLSEFAATSVRIKAEPDPELRQYYIYCRDKAWYDDIISTYGESMVVQLIQYPSAGSKVYSSASDEVWEGLLPSTDYYCGVVGIDRSGAESLKLEPFRTAEGSGVPPSLEVSLDKASATPHEKLSLHISSDKAYLVRYYVAASADVMEAITSGETKESLIADRGTDLTVEEVAQVNSAGGFRVDIEFLWPETEYTAIVAVRSAEQLETYRQVVGTTSKRPAVARVESELFDILPGRWSLSYRFVNNASGLVDVENVEVEIAAGADAASAADCRSRNRLVVLGYQFLDNYATSPWPYYSPGDLKSQWTYWRENPGLAYRDYGPKFYLEIGEGDVVTVPTSKSEYLCGWSDSGPIEFYGCDYDHRYIAPVAFPVTVSADRNTITICECHAGSEFSYGVYRPAVFVDGVMYNVADTDIVLRRIGGAKASALAAPHSGGATPALPAPTGERRFRWAGSSARR